MLDVFQIANAWVSQVQKAYAQDVAIVAYYGSYALGTASERSDLDLYYIPETEKAAALYRSFIVNGVPFEFWPVSWALAEKIASGKHRWSVAPSILVNAHVLYARSEADLTRFDALKAQIMHLQKPENKSVLVAQAWDVFQTASFHLETLRRACACQDVLGARWIGCQLVNAVLDCLALVNQTFFVRDWTSDFESIRHLHHKPAQTIELIEVITTSKNVVQIQLNAEDLLMLTRDILVCEQCENKKSVSLAEALGGYYAAIQEYTNKINSACEQRNLIKAGYWASQMQTELALMLAQVNTHTGWSRVNFYSEYGAYLNSLGWPNLAQAIETQDFEYIAKQARGFAKKAEYYLIAHSVPLNEFKTLEEAEAYLCGAGE